MSDRFTIRVPSGPQALGDAMLRRGIVAGEPTFPQHYPDHPDALIVQCTELTRTADIDAFAEAAAIAAPEAVPAK